MHLTTLRHDCIQMRNKNPRASEAVPTHRRLLLYDFINIEWTTDNTFLALITSFSS